MIVYGTSVRVQNNAVKTKNIQEAERDPVNQNIVVVSNPFLFWSNNNRAVNENPAKNEAISVIT